MKIGQNIKRIREIKNINVKTVAEKLGIAVNSYQRIERGEVDINTEKIQIISQLLGVTPAELVGFDEKFIVNNIGEKAAGNAQVHVINHNSNDKLIESQQELILSLKRENDLLIQKIAKLEGIG